MKTREEIKAELKQIDSIKDELRNQLYELDTADNLTLLQSFQYLIGECFKDNDAENNYYKIVAIPRLFGTRVLCETILCQTESISISQHLHYPDNSDQENGKITTEEFDSYLEQTYCKILNKQKYHDKIRTIE